LSNAMKDDKRKALEAGCIGYLTKPIGTRNFFGNISSTSEIEKRLNVLKENFDMHKKGVFQITIKSGC